jgi:hypothetical protein
VSLGVGQVQLQEAYKELRLRWADARSQWDDAMSRDFGEQHVDPLERYVRSAVSAMEQLSELVWQARRECE